MDEPTKILICGDRTWSDRDRIREALRELPAGYMVIHGAAPGADTIAGELAAELGMPCTAYPADWSKGRAAGPIRNRLMLDQCPALVIAFHDPKTSGKGTRDCVRQAKRRGIPVKVVNSTP